MKVSWSVLLIILIALTGCIQGEWIKDEGQVCIDSEIQNAIIYIDGNKKAMTGDRYTTITTLEGDHKVRVFKKKDREWYYEGVQNIFVWKNAFLEIKIDMIKKPTVFRLERLAKEAIERGKKYGIAIYLETYYDSKTKLMWQDNNDSKSVEKDWCDAKHYCKKLIIGEYNNWRLPSYSELLEIVDYKKVNPSIRDGFKNTKEDRYWSSSEYVSETSSAYGPPDEWCVSILSGVWPPAAWCVSFSDGHTFNSPIRNKMSVRCVRDR